MRNCACRRHGVALKGLAHLRLAKSQSQRALPPALAPALLSPPAPLPNTRPAPTPSGKRCAFSCPIFITPAANRGYGTTCCTVESHNSATSIARVQVAWSCWSQAWAGADRHTRSAPAGAPWRRCSEPRHADRRRRPSNYAVVILTERLIHHGLEVEDHAGAGTGRSGREAGTAGSAFPQARRSCHLQREPPCARLAHSCICIVCKCLQCACPRWRPLPPAGNKARR